MTELLERGQVLGAVVCRCHDDEVDLLCSRCLARLVVPAARTALEDDAERFVTEHRHAVAVPTHRWHADGTFAVGACVGTVCDGSPVELAAVREIIGVARAAGWSVRVLHAEQPAMADASQERRDAVRRLGESDGVDVVFAPTWTYDALVSLAETSDVRVVVVPHLWMPTTLLQVAVSRRCRALGTKPPVVLGWRGGPEAPSRLCEALEACV